MSVSVHSRQLALRPSNRADKERRVADTPHSQAGQPTDDLVDQLLGRWNGEGAPRAVLKTAARVDKDFRYSHGGIRCDRRWVANLAFLAATLGGLAVVAIGMDLAKMLIAGGELAARMGVLGLLLAACWSVANRGGRRLPIQLAILAAFIAILVIGPPENILLQRWDRTAAILGTLLIAAKAMRLFADRMVDRSEARLLLKAAGR
jgi:hypothetical protein